MYEVEDERPKEKEAKKPTQPDSKAKVGYCPFCFKWFKYFRNV